MADTKKTKLVFFIIDGFSNYYLHEPRGKLDGVDKILKNGARAEYVTPVFPSFSLPNYYSMFTGQTPEHHGMISNIMYDTDLKEMFDVSMNDRDNWYARAPETAWVTTQKMGIRTSLYWPWFVNFACPSSTGDKLHCFEPDSDFMAHHSKPEDCNLDFDKWMDEKLEKIVDELKQDVSQFIVVYWPTLDNFAHYFGPRSKEAMAELKLADCALNSFQSKVDAANLWDSVNLIVVSDHGQTPVPPENRVFIDDYAPNVMDDVEVICENEPIKYVFPASGKIQEVYETLKNAKMPNVNVYLNEDVPDRFAYKNAKCASPILLLADPGFAVCIKSVKNKYVDSYGYSLGIHGYDNEFPDMRAILLARGSKFRKGFSGCSVRTLDYYSFIFQTLGVQGLPCDADHERVRKFMV